MAEESRLSREQVRELIQRKRYQLTFDQDIPRHLQADIEVIQWVLQHSQLAYSDLPPEAQASREILRLLLTKKSYSFRGFPEPLRDDQELALLAVQQNASMFEWCSARLRGERAIVEAALAQSGYNLRLVTSDALQHDRDLIRLALSTHDQAFLGVPDDLLDDEELLGLVIAGKITSLVFARFPQRLRDDDTVALKAVQDDPGSLSHVSARLADRREIVHAAVSQRGMMLEYASARLRDDEETVLLAMPASNDTYAVVRHMSDRLRADKAVVLAAVRCRASVLADVDPVFRDDPDVLAACMTEREGWGGKAYIEGAAYAHFGDAARADRDTTLRMSSGTRFPLDAVPESLRADPEIVRNAVGVKAANFSHVPAALRDNLDFVRALYEANSEVLTYMDDALKQRLFTTTITTEPHRGRHLVVELVLDDGVVSDRRRAASRVSVHAGSQVLVSAADVDILTYESDGPVGSYLSERCLRNLVLCGDFVFFVEKNSGRETFTNHQRTLRPGEWGLQPQPNDDFLKHTVYLLNPAAMPAGQYDTRAPAQGGRRLYWGRKERLVRGLQVFEHSGSTYREAVTILKQTHTPPRAAYVRTGPGALKKVAPAEVDALAGAARVYVDGQGWRWLLPNAAGPFAALDVLLATDDAADWQWLQAHVDAATPYQRALLVRHFATTGVADAVTERCDQ